MQSVNNARGLRLCTVQASTEISCNVYIHVLQRSQARPSANSSLCECRLWAVDVLMSLGLRWPFLMDEWWRQIYERITTRKTGIRLSTTFPVLFLHPLHSLKEAGTRGHALARTRSCEHVLCDVRHVPIGKESSHAQESLGGFAENASLQ